MVPNHQLQTVPGRDTGDAEVYDKDGFLVGYYEAGVWYPVDMNDNFFVIDSIPSAANVPDPEPEKKAKPKEPFYAKFNKKGKRDYLR